MKQHPLRNIINYINARTQEPEYDAYCECCGMPISTLDPHYSDSPIPGYPHDMTICMDCFNAYHCTEHPAGTPEPPQFETITPEPCQDTPSIWKRILDWSHTFWGDLILGFVIIGGGFLLAAVIGWLLIAMYGGGCY